MEQASVDSKEIADTISIAFRANGIFRSIGFYMVDAICIDLRTIKNQTNKERLKE